MKNTLKTKKIIALVLSASIVTAGACYGTGVFTQTARAEDSFSLDSDNLQKYDLDINNLQDSQQQPAENEQSNNDQESSDLDLASYLGNSIKPTKAVFDPSSLFGKGLKKILATATVTKSGISIKWQPVDDAEAYDVYWAVCNGENLYNKLATVSSGATIVNFKEAKASKKYKFIVTARYNNGEYIAKSYSLHVAMPGCNKANAVKVKSQRDSIPVLLGHTYNLNMKSKYDNSKEEPILHAAEFRYFSSNRKIASVTTGGTITAKKIGTCNIYALANNGTYATIDVTVLPVTNTDEHQSVQVNNVSDATQQLSNLLSSHVQDFSIQYTGDLSSDEFFNEFVKNNDFMTVYSELVGINNDNNLFDADCIPFSVRKLLYSYDKDTGTFNGTVTYNDSATQLDTIYLKIQDIVDNQLKISSGMKDTRKIQLIHDWICDNVKYFDEDDDLIGTSLYKALFSGKAKCMGFSLLANAMFEYAGIDSKIVSSTEHAWNVVKVDGSWYTLDTTWDSSTNSHKYYLCAASLEDAYDMWGNLTATKYAITPSKHSYLKMSESNISLSAGEKASLSVNGLENKTHATKMVLSDGSVVSIKGITLVSKDIKWSSNNDNVKVSNGKVVAKKKGRSIVTATVDSGDLAQKFSCIVTVK